MKMLKFISVGSGKFYRHLGWKTLYHRMPQIKGYESVSTFDSSIELGQFVISSAPRNIKLCSYSIMLPVRP